MRVRWEDEMHLTKENVGDEKGEVQSHDRTRWAIDKKV